MPWPSHFLAFRLGSRVSLVFPYGARKLQLDQEESGSLWKWEEDISLFPL